MTRDDWTQLEDVPNDPPEQVKAMWQRTDGLVLSLEKLSEQKWQLVTLPENFRQDNQVIEKIGEYDSKGLALKRTTEYMKEN